MAGLTTTGRGDYSVQLSLDKQGDGKYFSAIDLGWNNSAGRAATRRMTTRLIAAASNNDPRLRAVREFYGTTNGRTVTGRSHNSETGSWRAVSSDSSHLFHVHISFFRKFSNNRQRLMQVAEVLLGVPGGGGVIPDRYIVQAGDTLSGIAERFNTTVAALVELNNISNPDVIEIGQVLLLRPLKPGGVYDDTISPIFGWDASDYDHDRGMRSRHIEAAEEEGIRFFTHKVTDGTGAIHSHCGEKLKAAETAGIPFVGAYVVTRTPGNNNHGSISAQVDFAIKELDRQWAGWRKHPGFFWQVDLEKWPYDAVAAKHGVEMCRLLRQRTDRATILYAPRWAYGNDIPGHDPLWNSHYVSGSGTFKSLYPGNGYPGWNSMSGRIPAILQFTSRAVTGGQHTTDSNAFRGTEADFARLIGAEGEEMPTVDEIWNTDGVVETPGESPSHPDHGGTNTHWTAANVIRSTNDHARKVLSEVRAAHAEQKLRDEAVLAAVQGIDSGAVLTRVDEKAAEVVSAINSRADELVAQIEAVSGAEVAAEEIVRLIGEALVGGTDG